VAAVFVGDAADDPMIPPVIILMRKLKTAEAQL